MYQKRIVPFEHRSPGLKILTKAGELTDRILQLVPNHQDRLSLAMSCTTMLDFISATKVSFCVSALEFDFRSRTKAEF
jgi:hypothetical protein